MPYNLQDVFSDFSILLPVPTGTSFTFEMVMYSSVIHVMIENIGVSSMLIQMLEDLLLNIRSECI